MPMFPTIGLTSCQPPLLDQFLGHMILTKPEAAPRAVKGRGEGLRFEPGPFDGMIASGVCDLDIFSWPIHGI